MLSRTLRFVWTAKNLYAHCSKGGGYRIFISCGAAPVWRRGMLQKE